MDAAATFHEAAAAAAIFDALFRFRFWSNAPAPPVTVFTCFLQKSVNLSKKSDLTADTKGNFKITRFEKVRFALQEILCGPIFVYILSIKCRVYGQIHVSLKHAKIMLSMQYC